MVVLLVRVRPDGFFDEPPKQIVETGDVGEGAERIPDRNFRVTVKQAEQERDRGADGKSDGAVAEGEDAAEKE